jgi:DNA-binding transcriptional MocR family regulator
VKRLRRGIQRIDGPPPPTGTARCREPGIADVPPPLYRPLIADPVPVAAPPFCDHRAVIDPPLYARIAHHYREAIASGALAPGSAMPSVRSLVRLHRISVSTALQACRRLEEEGLLEARPRAGYFVRPSRAVRPAGGLAIAASARRDVVPDDACYRGIHDRVSRYVALGDRHPVTVDFGATYATPDAYPGADLRRAAARALRDDPDLMVRPIPPKGAPALRAALARRALDAGVTLSPDEIIVTQGCTEALNVALRAVTSPGDAVAVESPAYFGLLQVIESLGLRAVEIPTDPATGFAVAALEFALTGGWPPAPASNDTTGDDDARPAAPAPAIRAVVVVPHLQNPMGSVMPEAEQQRLVRLCAAHDVALIEDDTYAALVEGDRPAASIRRWDATGVVIHCASLRKTIAPGMRLGWMTGGRWQARIEMLKYVQSRANEALSQQAMGVFLASSACDRHLARLRRRLRRQREQTAAALSRHFPTGTRVHVPEGGMMLWVELPPGHDAGPLFEAALAEGIRFVPGSLFSNTGRFARFMRISCGRAFDDEVDAALQRLGALAATIARRVGG